MLNFSFVEIISIIASAKSTTEIAFIFVTKISPPFAILAVFKTNEYYNKNWNEIGTKHPKLQWQLLCQAGNTGKIEFHKWLGLKGKKSADSKIVKFLSERFPNMKQDEVELLAKISTKAEIKQYAESLGMDKKDVKL